MLTQYQLKNKLKVLLVESHRAPVVSVQMWVKTGSADEKKTQEGISHFIEHLVFKGTRRYQVGEIAKTIEGSGGELNAYTTFDYTVFHVTMSKEDLEVGLDVIAEMMGYPTFDKVEVDRERDVVIEEIKRSQDSPHRVSSQQLFSTMFKKHPYGIPVIGYDKNIKKVPVKVLRSYFDQRYVTPNMTLVVAGDFHAKEIKRQIESHYGQFKKKSLKKISRKRELAQKKMNFVFSESSFQECHLNVAFRVPSVKHKDVPALDVMSFILGQGDSSRLVRRLRLEKSLVTSVGSGCYTPLDPGLFSVSVTCQQENLVEVLQIIKEELTALLTCEPDFYELDRASFNLEADEIFGLETVDGLAQKVGFFQTLLNDPKFVDKYLSAVQKLKPSDILKISRRYLTSKNLSVSLMAPQSAKGLRGVVEAEIKTLAHSLDGGAKAKVCKAPSEKIKKLKIRVPISMKATKSEIEKTRLNSGALLITKPNHEVPLVHLKMGFLGGLRKENKDFLGTTSLLGNTWTTGSSKFSESEINSIIESCAGTLTAFAGRNSVGMTLETIKAKENEALNLFSDVMVNPTFPEEYVKREIDVQRQHLKTRSDHPSYLASQLFMEKIFKNHPYGLDMMGTEQTLSKISSQIIQHHWQSMVTSENAIIVVVGDVDKARYKEFFSRLTSDLKSGRRLMDTLPVSPLKESEEHFIKSEKEQTHIIVGYRGLPFTDKKRYDLQVLEAILAGQGGRLFIELRDKASLAYSVAPVQMSGIETGYFGAYIGCSPEKAKTALKMIDDEIQKLLNHPPTDDEIIRAKKYLIGRNHIDLQRNGAQASSILFDELYGIDCRETFRFGEHIHHVTKESVYDLCQSLFKQPKISVAVGPTNPF